LAAGFDFAERNHQGLDAFVRRLTEVTPYGFIKMQVHCMRIAEGCGRFNIVVGRGAAKHADRAAWLQRRTAANAAVTGRSGRRVVVPQFS